MGKTLELSIPGRYESIKDACVFVIKGAGEAGFKDDDLFHIELACDEACTNVIEHSYGAENKGDIRVAWEYDDLSFTITISDDGLPFQPSDIAVPVIPSDREDLDHLKVGGLGIYFMRKLMDEVSFESGETSGNILVMVKRRPNSSQ